MMRLCSASFLLLSALEATQTHAEERSRLAEGTPVTTSPAERTIEYKSNKTHFLGTAR